MDERDIQIFQTLMETKNVTKTAQTLYTTQSAITKRLHKLEEELGAPLFLRSVKGLIRRRPPMHRRRDGTAPGLPAAGEEPVPVCPGPHRRPPEAGGIGELRPLHPAGPAETVHDRLSGSADFRHHRPEPGPVHPAPGGEAVFGRAPGPFPLVRPEPAPFQRKGVCGHQ